MQHNCINEQRIGEMEGNIKVLKTSLDGLTEKIGELAEEVKWLIRLLLLSMLGTISFLLVNKFF